MVGVGLRTRGSAIGLLLATIVAACGNSDGASHPGGSGGKSSSAQGGVGGVARGGSAGSGVAGELEGGGDTQGGESGAPSGNTGGRSDAGGSGGNAPVGGSSGREGGAGEGGASDLDLQPVGAIPPDKIDLLFVIDNSISMADKQEILRAAVPLLVRRLVTPVCVDAAGNPNGQLANPSGACAAGEPEFSPLKDFHIGVISSSLGSHGGADICSQTNTGPEVDDKAHLLPSVRTGLNSWNASGFLAWDPEQRATPPGSSNAATLVAEFQNMVVAAGEKGCGYESTLEAWYRFLIDPSPPSAVTLNATRDGVEVTAPDSVTLAQRAAFLRPDSLVGVVVLSDENDCSVIDSGQGYLVGTAQLSGAPFRMPRATSACSRDPNDPCCAPCATGALPTGCVPLAEDTECKKGTFYAGAEESLNLRCWNQKLRFGVDLLQPISRYVSGLTERNVVDRTGATVQNPLFQAPPGLPRRDPSQVFFMGIVGVPWQDVADEPSRTDSVRLKYLSARELETQGRFTMMLGDKGARPTDGLMYETYADRSTLGFAPHPLTGEALAPSTSTNPKQNSMNGHESAVVDAVDLQFACIFPLTTPRSCTSDTTNCDCHTSDAVYNRALCQPPQGGTPSTTQYYAKAYPGLRHLELIRELGRLTNNSIAASICPKVQMAGMPTTDPNFGYNPAVTALVDRMKVALAPACLSEAAPVLSDGSVACHVLEVDAPAPGSSASCSCTGAGRGQPSAATSAAIRSRLARSLSCDGAGQPSCESLCVCEVNQLTGAERSACQNDPSVPASSAGFCYVDADRKLGDLALVEDCPADRKRRLRFVGADLPRPGSANYVFCPR